MAGKQTIQGKIVQKACEDFKSTPSLTLAKKIYKENPESFKNVESVRTIVRLYRGKMGNKMKQKMKTSVEYIPKTLPVSYAEDFTPYEISQSRVLIISDLHFPYQNNEAIEVAINYGIEKDVNCVLINGDLFDFATISRHEKDWRQRSVKDELDAVKQFLDYLQDKLPKARVIFKEGNHCERFEKWLFHKAPEYFGIDEFRLDVLLNFGERGITHVKDKRPIKLGKLTVLHGHELAGGSGGVNPARATFLKTLDSVIVGHYHKTSSHTETTMNGNVISVESMGCLCGLNPYYMPINKWNHGFAYVELDVKTGHYQLQNKKIIKGIVY